MKRILLSIIILLSAIISDCVPDRFTLNQKGDALINGMIISNLDGVEVTGDNALLIHKGGRADMRAGGQIITQLTADLTVNILEGEGVRLAFRTVSNNYDVHPSLKFDYTTKGSIIRENDRIIAEVDSIKAIPNVKSRVLIQNLGNTYNILVDCDTVYYGKTRLPATEFLIIESLENSEINLTGISFIDSKEKIDK